MKDNTQQRLDLRTVLAIDGWEITDEIGNNYSVEKTMAGGAGPHVTITIDHRRDGCFSFGVFADCVGFEAWRGAHSLTERRDALHFIETIREELGS